MSIASFLSLQPRVGDPRVRFVVAQNSQPGYTRLTMNAAAFDKSTDTNDRVLAQADLMAQTAPMLKGFPGSRAQTFYTDAQKVQHPGFSINIPMAGGAGGQAQVMMDVNSRLLDVSANFIAAGGDVAALANIPPNAIGLAILEKMVSDLGTPAPAPGGDEDIPF